jgi:ATP-dependent 26S proteasome regulatory subunit
MPVPVVLSKNNKKFFRSSAELTLEKGVYRISQIYFDNEYIPTYEPIVVDNDPVISCDPLTDQILHEIRTFLKNKERFQKLNVTHKRGFILHGKPGCGKSATLRLIEESFVKEFSGIVLVWEAGISIRLAFETLRKYQPTVPIIAVAEDLEANIEAFEEEILEFLDGQKALDNFVLIATTNQIDQIPDRIKARPSRIDRVIEIAPPSFATISKYLESKGLQPYEVQNLLPHTSGMSIAQVKELLIAVHCFEEVPEKVRTRLMGSEQELFEAVPLKKSDDDED